MNRLWHRGGAFGRPLSWPFVWNLLLQFPARSHARSSASRYSLVVLAAFFRNPPGESQLLKAPNHGLRFGARDVAHDRDDRLFGPLSGFWARNIREFHDGGDQVFSALRFDALEHDRNEIG